MFRYQNLEPALPGDADRVNFATFRQMSQPKKNSPFFAPSARASVIHTINLHRQTDARWKLFSAPTTDFAY